MNKQEILDKIIAKYENIETLKKSNEELIGTVQWYHALVLNKGDMGSNLIQIHFYVQNEGTKTEFADFMEGESWNKFDSRTDEEKKSSEIAKLVEQQLRQKEISAEVERQLLSAEV